MLERVNVQLNDPSQARRYWAGPPQVSAHQSVPDRGMRGSGKQSQVEGQR